MGSRFSMDKANPQSYAAMLALEKYLISTSIDKKFKDLIKIRASQINGCDYCIELHTKEARQHGETEQRINALNAWRDTAFFTPEERAVLAFTEAVTLIADHHVSDEIYDEVRKYFDEAKIAEIIMAIVTINGWNRIMITSQKTPAA